MEKQAKQGGKALKIFGTLEREVMEIIWVKRSVTVREIFEQIKQKRKIAYTTVMTIMDRLFTKGILKRKKLGKTYLYNSFVTKSDFFEKTSKNIINDLIHDFGDVAIAQFVNTLDTVDPKKLKILREKLKLNRNEIK
ncbi:MAG: BlaI/MecI/CopY family transcriptional regulator [bacterium]|nr:BlaI/MecI/CopY family transcriptional regulator [bacterium]